MRRVVVVIALLSTILPLIVAAKLLTDAWFWEIGLFVALYAGVVLAVHVAPWRPLPLKLLVVLANASVFVWQGAQLIGEPSANALWAQLLAAGYPLLVIASIFCLPGRGSLVGFLAGDRPSPP